MRTPAILMTIRSFLQTHSVLVATLMACAGCFLWTNWYFSPERRLLRLSELLSQEASEATREADREIWNGSLKPRVATERWSRLSCFTSACEVSVVKLYTVMRPELKHFVLEVSAQLAPEFGNLASLSFLPVDVRWTASHWRWSVAFHPSQEKARPTIVSGAWNELERVPRPEGSVAIGKYLQATQAEMVAHLQRQDEP